MHTTNLRKVGGSIMLAIPPTVLDMLHLHSGAKVGLAVRGNRLIVEPQPVPRYTLDDLLAECNSTTPLHRRDREWIAGASTGKELI